MDLETELIGCGWELRAYEEQECGDVGEENCVHFGNWNIKETVNFIRGVLLHTTCRDFRSGVAYSLGLLRPDTYYQASRSYALESKRGYRVIIY